MLDTRSTRRLLACMALLGAIGATGCDDDDPAAPDPEPEVETLRLQLAAGGGLAAQTVDLDIDGSVTGGPIQLKNGVARAFTASALRADGTAEPLITAADFELRVQPAAASGVVFTRSGAFAGTLTGSTNGNTSADFLLWHLEEDHDDFDQTAPITVAP